MTTFISYASQWDLHKGAVSICDLSTAQQNEIIKLTLDPVGDVRQLAIDQNIIKAQIDGLWNVIVYVGIELENRKLISNFLDRDDNDIETIVQFLSGTKLGDRLKDRINLEDQSCDPLDYDWTELERQELNNLTTDIKIPLFKVKENIYKHIATVIEELKKPQSDYDLSPIRPSLSEKIVDIYYYIFNRDTYNYRVIDRKIKPFKLKYYGDVENEIQVVMGDEMYPSFLHAQAYDVKFLEASFLLYEAGFHARIPPFNLVQPIVHGLYVYTTKSKSSGIISILNSANIIENGSVNKVKGA